MKILKFKKMAGNKYKIIFDNGKDIILHENIIIKYNLLITMKIEEEFDDIIKDNNNYMIYDMIVKYISKKIRCESEIRKYLKSKEIGAKLSDKIIIKLRKNNLLNDRDYIKSYISDKVRLNNLGLNKIKSELYKLQLDKDIVDEEISKYSNEDIIDILEKLIDKKIKSNRSYGGNLLKQKIITDFINKGYNKEDIINILNKKDLNSDELYNKEYSKLYNKYKTKYNGSELEYFIKQKLYSKGFVNDTIRM